MVKNTTKLLTIVAIILLITPVLAAPSVSYTVSVLNKSTGAWNSVSPGATIYRGDTLAFNATITGATQWEYKFGDGTGLSTTSVLSTTHIYEYGNGGCLMLVNGWSTFITDIVARDATGNTDNDPKTFNFTTPMADIVFVNTSQTIAPLNESYANAFMDALGGNTTIPATWTGIDFVAGLTGVQNVYVSVMGLSLFYIIVFAIPFIMIWLTSKDFVVPGVLGGFLGVWMIVRLPGNMRMLAVVFIVMSIVAILYSLFKEKM